MIARWLKCCFTSTETVGLLGTRAQDGYLDFHTDPQWALNNTELAVQYMWVHGCWAVQWSWFSRVNALCNLSRKKSREVSASLPGRFLSRRCFTLYITMEVEPRIAKQYKFHHCCSWKKLPGKGDGGWGKNVFVSFFGWPEDCEFVEKMRFGASYSTSNRLLLVARHILITRLQKCL